MKCEFCGSDHLPVTLYKCKGIVFDAEVSAHVAMCICCDANTDKEWLAEKLGMDEIIEIKSVN